MRGPDIQQETLFSTVIPEQRVPKDHPLRPIREMVNKALAKLDEDFNALYAKSGKPSIPPEKLLRAQLLKAFYTIRSDRQLMEQIDYNLLLRWFVGFSMDDEVWDHSTFSKNRDRLLEGEIAHHFSIADHLTVNQLNALGELLAQGFDTAKAWRVKERLKWIRQARTPRAARCHITRFINYASGLVGDSHLLELVRKALQTLRTHAERVIRRWTSTYTNARMEGLNSPFQAARARARGY